MTTLAQGEAIATATLAHGRSVGAAPLTVAVPLPLSLTRVGPLYRQ